MFGFVVVLVVLVVLVVFVVFVVSVIPKKKKYYTKNELMVKAMKEILESPGKKKPWIDEFVKTLPTYTFPIKGICKDGELVKDVLKRLDNQSEKLIYFKNYMGIA